MLQREISKKGNVYIWKYIYKEIPKKGCLEKEMFKKKKNDKGKRQINRMLLCLGQQ